MNEEKQAFLDGLPKNLSGKPVEVVNIGGRKVGKGEPCFVIVEVGANHRGDIKNALKFIDLAAETGADAVKFQHIKATGIAADTPISFEWNGQKQADTLSGFYKKSEMPYEWTEELMKRAKEKGIMFLSTPFDKESADLLDKLGVSAFKIASYEMTDDSLLRHVARKGKPIILSTGMAYLEEVAHAIRVINEEGNFDIVLTHCVSMYPPKSFADLNLKAIATMREAFKLPVGYSDHSSPASLAAPLAAVALGACVIEKHFTDERAGGSYDDPNSVEPDEFKKLVNEIRNVEAAMSGSGIKQPVSREPHALFNDEIIDIWARRSIYAARDITEGEVITEDMLVTLRPWGGIEPKHMKLVLGRKALKNIKARAPVTWNDL